MNVVHLARIERVPDDPGNRSGTILPEQAHDNNWSIGSDRRTALVHKSLDLVGVCLAQKMNDSIDVSAWITRFDSVVRICEMCCFVV